MLDQKDFDEPVDRDADADTADQDEDRFFYCAFG